MPHHDEHTQGSTQLTGKKHDIVTKYLADQLALEAHIYQAIDKQVKETQDEPDINPFLTDVRDTLEQHVNTLRSRLEALGGQATSPLKEAGASILGVAAGVIDKLRAEEVSKDLRDNYTAISLSNISYVMLITTCLACGDRPTADLASRNLKENAQIVMQIGHLIPQIVVRDLSDLTDLNASAVNQAREMYSEAWRNDGQNRGWGTSGSLGSQDYSTSQPS
jgi:ferritin-like metal-binding protein YciE